jgi:uncharacterized protein (UPF0262 family)
MPKHQRIAQITLDEKSVVWRSPEVEHERSTAIADLLHENRFAPVAGFDGPFHLHLALEDNRVALDIRTLKQRSLERVLLPLAPFRGIVKDYFLICESYYNAVKRSSPAQIEAIDMGRRGLHDEGSKLLRERLADKILLDVDTSRRLFTLLCVLHIRAAPLDPAR